MCLFPVSHHQLQHKKVIRRQYYAYTLSLKSSMMRHSMILRSCCQIWRWKMIRAISFRIVFTRGAWRHFWPPWNPFGGLEIWSSLFPNLSLQSSSAKSTISFACNNRGDRAYFGKNHCIAAFKVRPHAGNFPTTPHRNHKCYHFAQTISRPDTRPTLACGNCGFYSSPEENFVAYNTPNV